MTYKIELKKNERVITAVIDKKYIAVVDNTMNITVPIAVGEQSKKGYKPVECTFIADETRCLVKFKLLRSVDSISAIELIVFMAEQTLDNLRKQTVNNITNRENDV